MADSMKVLTMECVLAVPFVALREVNPDDQIAGLETCLTKALLDLFQRPIIVSDGLPPAM